MDTTEPPKPRASRTRTRPDIEDCRRGEGPTRLKNLPLSVEARERLGLFALKTGFGEGQIVDWLICTNPALRRYVVSDRGVVEPDA